jgi:lipopolysaccharide export system protein LptA
MVLVALALPFMAYGQNALARTGKQQPKECVVVVKDVSLKGVPSHFISFKTLTGQYNVFYGAGFDARCEGTDQRLRSDSAEQWGDEKKLIVMGHVHYTEVRIKLDADLMTYFTVEERLVAEGNVAGVTNSGTHFVGPRAEYLRVARGVRDKSRLTAELRPDVWLTPKDAGPGSKDSVHVQADRVISENDSLVYAKGRVIIERPDLVATSDSAFMDNGKEIIRLSLTPKVVGRGDRKFTLEGDLIDAYSKQRQVERVRSQGRAKATSDDVTLTADTIDLRIADQKLQRAYAWGPTRALARAKDQDITADSIDVLLPAQSLREMRALRGARAEGKPDTSKIISKEADWLLGDTIVAHFDSASAGDTTKKPVVRQIVATGSTATPARSLRQVAPSGAGKTEKPNVSYNTGLEIIVDFKDGAVENVNVKGHATGIYLEAIPDSVRKQAPADTTGKKAPTPKKPPEMRP